MKVNRIDHVSINVNNLSEAKAFFLDIGLEVKAEWEMQGDQLDRIVGLKNVRTSCVGLRMPDGHTWIELVKYYTPANDWKALLKSFNSDDFYPFHETGELSDVTAPILCMVGEGEEIEVEAAVTYKKLHANAQIAVIPFAGHLVHRDQPDLYTRTLSALLEHSKAI
jgi:pimeloyl-ACP methyl ester carboxylesterase